MTDQKMTWKLGKNTYVREVPDGKVLREATIYVMYTTSLSGLIGPHTVTKTRLFGPGRTGWGKDSTYREVQATPDIGPRSLEVFEPDASGLTEMLIDFRIKDDRSDWMTDIFCWTPFSIVRQNVRDFLEDTDPGGNFFHPVRLYGTASDKKLPGKYHVWLPKRRLFLPQKYEAPQKDKVKKPFGGFFALSDYAWQLTHNQALRVFANRNLPTFGISFNFQIAFNAQTFRALKEENFTGLVERESDSDLNQNVNWNVGHFE